MSHQIVKHRFALYFEDPIIGQYKNSPDTLVLFTEFSSANNVSPRTYSGQVRCLGTAWRSDPAAPIAQHITLPPKIWKEAYYAEDGGTKVFPGRDISGIGWIQGWQKIIRRPIPIALEDGRLVVNPELSLWISKERVARYLAGENPGFGKHDEDKRNAWNELIMPLLRQSGPWNSRGWLYISNIHQLSQACALLGWQPPDYKGYNEGDSFGINLCLSESAGESLARIFHSIEEPHSEKPPTLAPGMIVELYGHTYTLTAKSKSSWHAQKDGKIYRIGPAKFRHLKILQSAA